MVIFLAVVLGSFYLLAVVALATLAVAFAIVVADWTFTTIKTAAEKLNEVRQ